jgi:hypothetical protein
MLFLTGYRVGVRDLVKESISPGMGQNTGSAITRDEEACAKGD